MNFPYKSSVLAALAAASLFAACKDESDTVEEYPNWQAVNEAAFQTKFNETIALTDKSRQDTIRCYSLLGKLNPTAADYIVVEKKEPIAELAEKFKKKYPQLADQSPILTSDVTVSYRGRLQPSTSYREGLVFDQSFTTPSYDITVAKARSFTCGSLISGFTTALMNMKVGDHWFIYIPHQLAYGNASSDNVQPYSMLTFEVIFEGFK